MSRSRLIKHSAAGQAPGYFYNDEEPHHRSVQGLTKDQARWRFNRQAIAFFVAKILASPKR
jgi:hypothetical protein